MADDPAMLASELRMGRATAWIGVGVLTAAVIYITSAFAGIADPTLLGWWAGAFAILLVAFAVTLVAIDRRQPDDAEIVGKWIPWLRTLAITSNLMVAASVWVLLPAAGPELRAFMTVMYVWYILIHGMAETRASRAGTVATVAVLGSLALFELVYQFAYSVPLAIFLMIFTLSMLAFRRLIRRALIETIHAKILADETGAALNKALIEVAAQRDAVTRFLASASHDLQQPVQAASLFFDQAIGASEAGARRRATEGARQAFASAQSLLQEMLEHLRRDSGAAPMRPAPVAIDALLAEVALENEALAAQSGAAIRIAASGVVVTADPRLLRRIFSNLTANALTHSGCAKLLLGARRRQGQVLLYAIDNGVGVSEAAAERIFDEFNTARPRGFGLGLSTSRRFARAMGAELTLDQRWTGGACFVLTLPPNLVAAAESALAGETLCKAA